jgi:hypothetical protein
MAPFSARRPPFPRRAPADVPLSAVLPLPSRRLLRATEFSYAPAGSASCAAASAEVIENRSAWAGRKGSLNVSLTVRRRRCPHEQP